MFSRSIKPRLSELSGSLLRALTLQTELARSDDLFQANQCLLERHGGEHQHFGQISKLLAVGNASSAGMRLSMRELPSLRMCHTQMLLIARGIRVGLRDSSLLCHSPDEKKRI